MNINNCPLTSSQFIQQKQTKSHLSDCFSIHTQLSNKQSLKNRLLNFSNFVVFEFKYVWVFSNVTWRIKEFVS